MDITECGISGGTPLNSADCSDQRVCRVLLSAKQMEIIQKELRSTQAFTVDFRED